MQNSPLEVQKTQISRFPIELIFTINRERLRIISYRDGLGMVAITKGIKHACHTYTCLPFGLDMLVMSVIKGTRYACHVDDRGD